MRPGRVSSWPKSRHFARALGEIKARPAHAELQLRLLWTYYANIILARTTPGPKSTSRADTGNLAHNDGIK